MIKGKENIICSPEQMAVELYAPFYLLLSISNCADIYSFKFSGNTLEKDSGISENSFSGTPVFWERSLLLSISDATSQKKEREKIKDRYEKYIDDFFRKYSLLSD